MPPAGDEPWLSPAPFEPARLADDDAAAAFVYTPRKRFQHKWWKHILLLLVTIVTTTLIGGPWYSAGVLAILGAHEMGHYLACRYYRLDATLPYFLPFLLPVAGPQLGTLGAVIRIREPFPTRKVLFDVGIAGPIAGFVVLVPVLFLGMQWSQVVEVTPIQYSLGRPLLYQLARWMTFGTIPDTHFVQLHPLVFAGWVGMLATALNLLPFGQFDGGHITYATLGRLSTTISLATAALAVLLTFFSYNFLLMTILMVVMLMMTGPRHPPVIIEDEPLDHRRRLLALFAVVMFVLCFTPFPIRILAP